MNAAPIQTEQELLRRALFTPCDTQQQLHDWVHFFLGIDLPDCTVDPESNSNPMALLWEMYDNARKGNNEEFQRVLGYAARDSFKCVEKGTRLLSKDRGLVKVEDVKIGETIWSGFGWREVTNWVHDGEKESVKMELQNGLRLTVSPIHRVWVWEPGKLPTWKRVADLTEGDLVCVDTSIEHSFAEIDRQEFDRGYLLGVSHSFNKKVPESVFRSTSAMAGFVSGLLDTDGCISQKKSIDLHITAEDVVRDVQVILHALGVNCSVSSNRLYKNQRHRIHKLTISQNDVPALLRAGVRISADKANEIELPTKDNVHDSIPVAQARMLLEQLPVVAPRRKTGIYKPKFGRYSSCSRAKLLRALDWAEAVGVNPAEGIEFWRKTLQNRWVPVKSIERGTADFYDLTVEKDHSYWSNGIISHNTLISSIIEVLCLFHLQRSVAHMAAIESQAKKAQQYVKKYFKRPYLAPFRTTDNERTISITYYTHRVTGYTYSPKEYAALPPKEQDACVEHTYYIVIVIATMAGANCVDPNTHITMADGTEKPAMLIEPGDKVRSFHIGRREWEDTVVGSVSWSRKPAMRVEFEDGGAVVLSEDHPVFTRAGWVRARALRLGDKCFADTLDSPFEADSIEVAEGSAPCVNPRSALLGTLLGDASITWPKNKKGEKYGKGPRFQVSHGKAQYEYLLRKRAILERMGLRTSVSTAKNGITKLMSSVSPELSELYDLLYPEGKKAITQELLDQLDLEALAFWFMDDGSGSPAKVGSRKDKRLSLATCCFSNEENELIANWLFSKFGLNARVGTVTNNTGRVYPVVELDLESSRKLSAMLDPYIEPCMKYKFPCPSEYMDSRCIDCGTPIPSFVRSGFNRCDEHTSKLQGNDRVIQREFADKFTRRVSKLEFLGLRHLVDIHIDTEDEHLRNFVANSAILLHNSEHVPFLVLDELDLANPEAVAEAKYIPSIGQRGELPITFLTSTRKFSFGLVQKEIDEAHETGLQIRHWNIIDVTRACEPERHKPNEPRIHLWTEPGNPKRILSDEEASRFSQEERAKLERTQAYAGCGSCKLFAACKGRLATKQKSNSPLLKPIPHVISQIRASSVEKAAAQLMCWKPSAEGLIYSRLSRERHMLTAAQMAEKITGDKYPENFTKAQLIQLMKSRGMEFHAGLDWGWSDLFAVVTAGLDGHRLYVIDVIAAQHMELSQKLEICDARIKDLDPVIWPDQAYPDQIRTFQKKGYRMMKFKKDVAAGIEAVRWKLDPGSGKDPDLYFLAGDEGVEFLFKQLSGYHFKVDASGRPTEIPEDGDDDCADALRYLCQNLATNRSKVIVSQDLPHQEAHAVHQDPNRALMLNKIQELTGNTGEPGVIIGGQRSGRRGGFFFDVS